MKNIRSIAKLSPADAPQHTTQFLQPLKVCVVFDDPASAQSAEVLVKHTTSNLPCDMQLFAFDELDPPGPGVTAARSACDTDILVVAVRDDHALPHHVPLWIDLCVGLREPGNGGSLVVLVRKAGETPDPDSSLTDYLKTVAAIDGLSFFLRPQPKFGQRNVVGRGERTYHKG
jgi:hypothetical protein